MSLPAGQNIIKNEFEFLSSALPTSTSSLYCSFVGLDIATVSGANIMGLEITCTFLSSTDVRIVISNISPQTLIIYQIHPMLFGFNNAQLATATPTAARYTYGTFSSTSGVNSSLVWNNPLIRTFNTLVGLYSFNTAGSPFDFAITINSGSSVTAASTNSWTKFGFNIVLF